VGVLIRYVDSNSPLRPQRCLSTKGEKWPPFGHGHVEQGVHEEVVHYGARFGSWVTFNQTFMRVRHQPGIVPITSARAAVAGRGVARWEWNGAIEFNHPPQWFKADVFTVGSVSPMVDTCVMCKTATSLASQVARQSLLLTPSVAWRSIALEVLHTLWKERVLWCPSPSFSLYSEHRRGRGCSTGEEWGQRRQRRVRRRQRTWRRSNCA